MLASDILKSLTHARIMILIAVQLDFYKRVKIFPDQSRSPGSKCNLPQFRQKFEITCTILEQSYLVLARLPLCCRPFCFDRH